MLDIIIRNLTQRKIRTGLTIFGIGLGIFAMTVMGGMSEYTNTLISKSIDLMTNNIQVQPDRTTGDIINESKISQVRRVPGVSDANGILVTSLDPDEGGGFGSGNTVFGVDPDKQMKDAGLIAGRYLIPGDSYKVVIGSGIAKKFNLKVGDALEIKNKRVQRTTSIEYIRNFTVVGILEHTSTIFDNIVQMPLNIAQKFYKMENTVSFIYAEPAPGTDPEDVAKRIELNVERVRTDSPKKLKEQFQAQILFFSLITISAAVLAAIIGGLSVMNTMLMSISERTKEFGLMKALGAERKDILIMVMIEAALMGTIGGIFGIITGGIFTHFLNESFETTQGSALFAITPRLIMIGLLFATSLGIICGIYPAYRAVKMSPMEALKFE